MGRQTVAAKESQTLGSQTAPLLSYFAGTK